MYLLCGVKDPLEAHYEGTVLTIPSVQSLRVLIIKQGSRNAMQQIRTNSTILHSLPDFLAPLLYFLLLLWVWPRCVLESGGKKLLHIRF